MYVYSYHEKFVMSCVFEREREREREREIERDPEWERELEEQVGLPQMAGSVIK